MNHSFRQLSAAEKIKRIVLIILLLMLVAISLMPFVYMVTIALIEDSPSMKISLDMLSRSTWSFKNFSRVLSIGRFGRYILNSAIVAIISCVVTCLVSSMAAYGFAKKKFPLKKPMYSMYLLTMMVPSMVFLIPLYLLIKKMGLINTYWGIASPYAASAFGVILMSSFMKNVPDELLEAAEIDGSSEINKFINIVIPLIRPALISLTIFTFISCWGSFLWPLISTTKTEMGVVTLAVSRLKTDHASINFGYVMAGTTIAFLPPFVLYCFLQKQFVEGIALSGTKG